MRSTGHFLKGRVEFISAFSWSERRAKNRAFFSREEPVSGAMVAGGGSWRALDPPCQPWARRGFFFFFFEKAR